MDEILDLRMFDKTPKLLGLENLDGYSARNLFGELEYIEPRLKALDIV